MRLTPSSRFEQFGSVQIHELQRVIELDASSARSTPGSIIVPRDALQAIEAQMAIVILCMNEEFKTIDGVLSGIPHDCLIILVSNSERQPMDKYRVEVQLLENFCRDADRDAVALHQKDPGVAQAFASVGGAELVTDQGLVHSGKGEAMVLGMSVAAMTGRQYVGFVDADNFIPGSVSEYCKVYAAGLHLSESPDSMVRVSWSSKPKERDGRLMFDRRGRSSRVVNEWLNSLLQQYSGFGTDIIMTGNAGEHAMTMDLGLKLRLASGFAVEPYEYIYLFEKLSGHLLDNNNSSDDDEDLMDEPFFNLPSKQASHPQVHVHQIETRNPHLHDNKGDGHVQDMRLQALNMLYYSRVTPEPVRKALLDLMVKEKVLAQGQEPCRERVYPPVGSFDLESLYDLLALYAKSFVQFRGAARDFELIDRSSIPRSGTASPMPL